MPAGKRKGGRHRAEPDPLALAVGTRIRKLRLEHGYVFDAFVEECGQGRGYISELERGLVVPTIAALKAIADALEVTIADLVLGETTRERLFETARALNEAQLRRLLREAERLVRRSPTRATAYAPIPDPQARSPLSTDEGRDKRRAVRGRQSR